MIIKYLIVFMWGFYIRCFALGIEGDAGPIMTGKAVAFSYQVACQEKLIQQRGETLHISPNLSKKQIRSLLDQLLKKAIDNPTAENVRQYILTQNAVKSLAKNKEEPSTSPLSAKNTGLLMRRLSLFFSVHTTSRKPIATRASFINQRFRLARFQNTWFFHSVWV